MQKDQQRLTLAGHVISGLLASQDKEKPWEMGPLAVTALKMADAVLHFHNQDSLPEPIKEDEHPESNIITQPRIITP